MLSSNVNPHPLLLIVNYWEIRPPLIGVRLDELLKRGITQICTFIPWQSAESDISHSLTRFLQSLSDRRMTVYLILSPEVGVHYPNSGLPKDVISRKENMAQHFQSGAIPMNLPPSSFTLPSFYAPEFSKRYYSFLTRLDSLLADLERTQPDLLKGVTAVLTGSFWKYYRSAAASAQSPFGGCAGDYSSHAAVVYRQRSELFFTQREFTDPSAAATNRWKTRSMEEVNRRWFYQQSEDVFRSRSCQVIRKKSLDLKVAEIELFTPEADPSMTYSGFLQMLAGASPDFGRLSTLIEETGARASSASATRATPYVHWTSMGTFRALSDSQKQFLILKSLLLHGGQSGGIAMDEMEWLSLSSSFRLRVEALARSFIQGDLLFRNRALYLVPHLWSNYGPLWEGFFHRVGPGMTMVASLDLILKDRFSNLLIVDPSVILTKDTLKKLFAWATPGRILVLPRSKLYTEAARTELELALSKNKKIEIEYGLTYNLHSLGDGKLIVYEVPSLATVSSEAATSLQTFINSIVAVSEIESFCRLSDSRLTVVPFERKQGGLALFVLNGTRRKVAADIIFPTEVQIADLGGILSGNDKGLGMPDESSSNKNAAADKVAVANRFSLDVPPHGILSFTIEGTSYAEMRERKLAALISGSTRENVLTAASSELPGFSANEGLEELWN
ncbi:MAG: hypothetical protein ABIQ95_11310 [Bdellovibrionia bacterium]